MIQLLNFPPRTGEDVRLSATFRGDIRDIIERYSSPEASFDSEISETAAIEMYAAGSCVGAAIAANLGEVAHPEGLSVELARAALLHDFSELPSELTDVFMDGAGEQVQTELFAARMEASGFTGF